MNDAAIAPAAERHFFRCFECCNVFALEGPPAPTSKGWNGVRLPGAMCPTWIAGVRCDCGSGRLDWMGRVEADKVVRAVDRCPCDSRCTHAFGPMCSCSCGGLNHGTARVVRVVVVNDVPTVVDEGLEARLAAKAAWLAVRERAHAAVDADPIVIAMRGGVWIKDREDWLRATNMLAGLRKADKLATLKGRVNAAEKVIALATEGVPS